AIDNDATPMNIPAKNINTGRRMACWRVMFTYYYHGILFRVVSAFCSFTKINEGAGGCTPVPLKEMTCGEPGALSTMENVAPFGPNRLGEKTNVNTQLPPGVIVVQGDGETVSLKS